MCWVYGFPQWYDFWKNDARHFDEYDIVERGHSDTFYSHWGIATDPRNPKAFLLDTGGGCFYSDDCDFARESGGAWPSNRSNIRQLYTTSPAGAEGEFATTGIDELTSYGLRQDPFDTNHLAMLYTDVGLWMSGNGGASWHKGDSSGKLSSNVYDFEFDRHVQGVAYAAWSAQHDAPYQKAFAQNGARGGFAVSRDGGNTWERVGAGLPDQLVPVRMAVIYPTDASARAAGTGRTVWLATFGRGFWRSDDGDQSFVEANGGVSETSDGLILGADIVASADGAHVFALTTPGTSKEGKTAGGSHGRVYEWDAAASVWRPLAWLSGADVECPKTLFWHEASSTLYASCVAGFEKVSGSVELRNFGGGLFSFRPGDAALAAVDAASDVVGARCSVEGCTVDAEGNLFVSDLRGSVFLRRAGTSSFVKLYDGFHLVSKDVQLVSEAEGADGAHVDTLALPTFGDGLLRLRASMVTDLSDATVSLTAASCVYDGVAHKPEVASVKVGSRAVPSSGYSVSYLRSGKVTSDFRSAGAVVVRVQGRGGCVGTAKDVVFRIGKASASKFAIARIAKRKYTGKAVKPKPVVKFAGKKLKRGTDYKLSYKKNVRVGKATVVVTGRGNFTGSKKVPFRIVRKR